MKNIYIFTLLQALVNVLLQWNLSRDFLNMRMAFTIPLIGVYMFCVITNDCPLLMFHLSYYTIAHCIRLLRAKLANENKGNWPLRGYKEVLLHLREASDELNSAYSYPLLYIITTKLVIVSTYLFTIIFWLVNTDVVLPSSSLVLYFVAQVVSNMIHLLIVFHAAELPVRQVYTRPTRIS